MDILREKTADHEENECALDGIPCPYSKLGCRETFQRNEDMNHHLQSSTQRHLVLACAKLTDTEEELRTTKEKCVKLEQMDVLRAEQITKLEQRLSSLENRGWPGYNVYTWKIGGFNEIWKRAKKGKENCIQSDPFYIGECGYKFKMMCYPNGIAEGADCFLSLYVVNIEGEYDAILPWPFPKTVTLTLIDHPGKDTVPHNDPRTLTDTEKMWSSRPNKGEERSCGLARFMWHPTLNKRAHIVDDTIFIQAKFEQTVLHTTETAN